MSIATLLPKSKVSLSQKISFNQLIMLSLAYTLKVLPIAVGNGTRDPLNASGFYLQLVAYSFSLRLPERLARLLRIGIVELHLQRRL